MANAVVQLKPGNTSITTNASGAFTLRNLAPGRYVISVTRDGFFLQEDPRRGLTIGGLTVTLNAGQTLKNVVIPMAPAPVISGQVFAPHGERLAAALVQAHLLQYTPYGPQLKVARKTRSQRALCRMLGWNWLKVPEHRLWRERMSVDGLFFRALSQAATK